MATPPATAAIRAVQAEALSGEDAPIVIDLVPGVEIRVLPIRKWRLSALEHVNNGEYLKWASKITASVEDYDTFVETDPTLDELEDFSQRLGEMSTMGNSKTSSRSPRRSKSTRKS